jgi:hypothetical protein
MKPNLDPLNCVCIKMQEVLQIIVCIHPVYRHTVLSVSVPTIIMVVLKFIELNVYELCSNL